MIKPMLLGVLFLSSSLFGSIQTDCHSQYIKVPFSFCLTQDPDSSSKDLVYFFHGLKGNEQTWGKEFKEVYSLWQKRGFQPPKVLSISFGPIWGLSSPNSSFASGLYDLFVAKILPSLEQQVGFDSTQGKRYLVGMSMGGFNMLQLYFKLGEFIEKAVALCPLVLPISPYSTESEIASFVKRNNANTKSVHQVLELLQVLYPSNEDWLKDSPLDLAKQLSPDRAKGIHISVGMQDQLGFQEGAQALADLLKQKGAQVVWEPLQGGHCTLDQVAVADFLAH